MIRIVVIRLPLLFCLPGYLAADVRPTAPWYQRVP
jgi:hypothetical protein